jgi:hypothetical protein
MKACEAVKRDCETRLETRKKDFNDMKRSIEVINTEESKLKDRLDEMVKERDIYKTKCDRIKSNVKINRDNYKRSIEEFGNDQELDGVDPVESQELDLVSHR